MHVDSGWTLVLFACLLTFTPINKVCFVMLWLLLSLILGSSFDTHLWLFWFLHKMDKLNLEIPDVVMYSTESSKRIGVFWLKLEGLVQLWLSDLQLFWSCSDILVLLQCRGVLERVWRCIFLAGLLVLHQFHVLSFFFPNNQKENGTSVQLCKGICSFWSLVSC